MSKNKVEILLATYNGEKYIRELLLSLSQQTYSEFTILLSDDSSTDKTVEKCLNICEELDLSLKVVSPRVPFRNSKDNFEHLLRNSTAAYVMLADQDDFWKNYKVESSLKELQGIEKNYDGPVLVYTDLEVVNDELEIIYPSMLKHQKLDYNITNNPSEIICQNVVAGCTMIMNKKAVDSVLPFTNLKFVHDHWIAAKIASIGRVGYLDDATIKYRQHAANQIGFKQVGVSYFLKKLPILFEVVAEAYKLSQELGLSKTYVGVILSKVRISVARLLSK
jgi:glycosyltransferase involved in cell wall biosynthesis